MVFLIFLGILAVAAVFATLVRFANDGYGPVPTRPSSLDDAPWRRAH
jgi:hypothetical protein